MSKKRSGKPKVRIPRRIRRAVRERDNYTCRRCGDTEGGRLHSHHLKAEKDGGKATVENLITLCLSCHCEEHKIQLESVRPVYAERRKWENFLSEGIRE